MARVSIPTSYPGWEFFLPPAKPSILSTTNQSSRRHKRSRTRSRYSGIQGPDPVDRSSTDFRVILGSGDVSAPALLGRLALIDAAWLGGLMLVHAALATRVRPWRGATSRLARAS